jgi:glutamate/tyrosine decarboxylase-like PLP-dependent enzyme
MPRMQEEVLKKLSLFGHLDNLVREHPEFEVLCEPTVDRYCFRYMPNGLQDDRREVEQFLNRVNGEIVENVRREGFAITSKQVGGRVAIRLSIRSETTIREDIDATFEAIARWGRLCSRKQLSVSVS